MQEQDWEDFTLFEFKAGLMKKTGTQLAADPRRGTVRLLRVRPLFSKRANAERDRAFARCLSCSRFSF